MDSIKTVAIEATRVLNERINSNYYFCILASLHCKDAKQVTQNGRELGFHALISLTTRNLFITDALGNCFNLDYDDKKKITQTQIKQRYKRISRSCACRIIPF